MTLIPPPLETLSLKDGNNYTVIPLGVIEERVSQIVTDVFKDFKIPDKWWDPSGSASYDTSSEMGGQRRDIDFTAYDTDGNPLKGDSWKDNSDNWTYHDTGYDIVKVPCRAGPVFKRGITENIFASPVALTEPLKIRIITKENTWSTYALSGAQRSLWECLHKHPWFVLTGRPVVVEDVPIGSEDWISVDYSAATDNLSKEFSRLVIKTICDLTGLPFQLCYDSLCNHKIDYSKVSGIENDVIDQQNGQLMGSILSFIVLCIANAAVISLAVDPARFERKTPVKINGDDGLFLGNREKYQLWKDIASHVGLAPSVGKVYRSNIFCVINSQLFYKDSHGLVQMSAYPNASGMMLFDARCYSKPKGPLDLASSQELWLSGFNPCQDSDSESSSCKYIKKMAERQMKAEHLWFEHFKGVLNTPWVQTFAVDYYLPKCLGGLGLKYGNGFGEGDRIVSKEAWARARWFLEEGNQYKTHKKVVRTEKYRLCDISDSTSTKRVVVDVTPKVTDPFCEPQTWIGVSCLGEPSEETVQALADIGWTNNVEVIQKDPEDWNYDFLNMGKLSSSLISLAAINGLSIYNATRWLEESSQKDFFRILGSFRSKKQKYGKYWKGYREVQASTLQSIRISRGSRKLKPWSPRFGNAGYIEFLEKEIQNIRVIGQEGRTGVDGSTFYTEDVSFKRDILVSEEGYPFHIDETEEVTFSPPNSPDQYLNDLKAFLGSDYELLCGSTTT